MKKLLIIGLFIGIFISIANAGRLEDPTVGGIITPEDLDRAYLEDNVGVVTSTHLASGLLDGNLPDNVGVIASTHLAAGIAIPDNVGVITSTHLAAGAGGLPDNVGVIFSSHTFGNQMTFSTATILQGQFYNIVISSKGLLDIISDTGQSIINLIDEAGNVDLQISGGANPTISAGSGANIKNLTIISAFDDLILKSGSGSGDTVKIGTSGRNTEMVSTLSFNSNLCDLNGATLDDAIVDIRNNHIISDNLRLEEINAETWEFRNRGDTSYVGIILSSGHFMNPVIMESTSTVLGNSEYFGVANFMMGLKLKATQQFSLDTGYGSMRAQSDRGFAWGIGNQDGTGNRHLMFFDSSNFGQKSMWTTQSTNPTGIWHSVTNANTDASEWFAWWHDTNNYYIRIGTSSENGGGMVIETGATPTGKWHLDKAGNMVHSGSHTVIGAQENFGQFHIIRNGVNEDTMKIGDFSANRYLILTGRGGGSNQPEIRWKSQLIIAEDGGQQIVRYDSAGDQFWGEDAVISTYTYSTGNLALAGVQSSSQTTFAIKSSYDFGTSSTNNMNTTGQFENVKGTWAFTNDAYGFFSNPTQGQVECGSPLGKTYLVRAVMNADIAGGSAQTLELRLYKNGTWTGDRAYRTISGTNNIGNLCMITDVFLELGDTLELFVTNQSGTNDILNHTTTLAGVASQ